MKPVRFLVVMGVSGSGKTTIGQSLAQRLGWDFYDGDNFHPPENIHKMAEGIPLDDSDRAPWLQALQELIAASLAADQPGILACSALKARYRQVLLAGHAGVQVVYLKGNYDLIWSRMVQRDDHYMQPAMLRSQFAALEEPQDALEVYISDPIDKIVDFICRQLRLE